MTITAVFGLDDFVDAFIDCQEGADVAALAGGNIVTADLASQEGADATFIDASVIGIATLPIQESADVTFIDVAMNAVLAIQEGADACVINAIAPTSIIGHGKRFKVRPHDPKSIVIPSS